MGQSEDELEGSEEYWKIKQIDVDLQSRIKYARQNVGCIIDNKWVFAMLLFEKGIRQPEE